MARTRSATLLAIVASLTLAATVSAALGSGRWYNVGPGLDFHVYALHPAGQSLYVGGGFTNAGGNAGADDIARWDGAAWHSLGTWTSEPGGVRAIATYGSNVYVGGTFQNAGNDLEADFLAKFDGTSWSSFCTENLTGNVLALQVIGTTLYVGGAFQNVAGNLPADYLIACDLETGLMSTVVDGGNDIAGPIHALTAANGVLYAGGNFTNLDGVEGADYVAAYDGSWAALDSGATSIVRGLGSDGTNVYIGTDGDNVDGDARADHVAKWNGSAWSALGANTAGTDGWFTTTTFIYDLMATGSALVAAGSFQNANGEATADNIAWFDGTTWRPMGSNGSGDGPFVGTGQALASFKGHAYVGGIFTNAGGASDTEFVARHALRLPDARIGAAASGPFTGNDVYSTNGSGQAQNVSIRRGTSKSVYVSIQNDGILPASFKVKGTGTASGHTVRYFSGTTNVTTAVKNGTYTTASIAPGAMVTLRMRITLSTSAAASGTFRTTATSTVGTPQDAVRAVVSATN